MIISKDKIDLYFKEVGLFLLIIIPILGKAGGRDDSSDGLIIYQVSSFCLFLLFGFLGDFKSNIERCAQTFATFNNLLCLIFFIFAFLATIATSQSINGVVYSILTYLAFLVASLYTPFLTKMKTTFILIVLSINIFLLFCLTYYGVGGGRYIGSISPNHFADISLVSLFMVYFIEKRVIYRLIFSTISLVFIYLVGSRGGMLVLVVFLTLVILLNYAKTIVKLALPILMAITLLGLVMDPQILAVNSHINSFLGLDDPQRGLDSGMSGRDIHWLIGIADIMKSPYIGHGFRYGRSEDVIVTHMAYLEIIRDVGVVGFLLLIIFLSFLLLRIIMARYLGIKQGDEVWRLNIIIAIAIAIFFNGLIEIHLINIGFPMSLLLILILAYGYYDEKSIYSYTK